MRSQIPCDFHSIPVMRWPIDTTYMHMDCIWVVEAAKMQPEMANLRKWVYEISNSGLIFMLELANTHSVLMFHMPTQSTSNCNQKYTTRKGNSEKWQCEISNSLLICLQYGQNESILSIPTSIFMAHEQFQLEVCNWWCKSETSQCGISGSLFVPILLQPAWVNTPSKTPELAAWAEFYW